MDPLERLIADNPSFHHWPDGSPANWSASADCLRFIRRCLSPGIHTLETGTGQSTVVFALAGTRHVCITPQPEQTARVRDYCSRRGINETITFIHESSDKALSLSESIPDRLDFVFIDGAHRFPFPCLDWHYTERRLETGGIIGLDDYIIPSVRILHDFLCRENEWELIRIIGRTSFFRKLREADTRLDCQGQRINQVSY